jgi:predicted S18 family serine protease
MTGELTLTGRVLPIGGLKEKLLAAIRNGMEKVVLPKDNEEDWNELDKDIREAIKVEFAESADEVFALLFDKEIVKKKRKKSKNQNLGKLYFPVVSFIICKVRSAQRSQEKACARSMPRRRHSRYMSRLVVTVTILSAISSTLKGSK